MGFDILQHDDADKLVTVTTVDKRDLDALAQHCADMRSIGAGNGKDEKLAMSVDGWVINDWCTRKGITYREFMCDSRIQTRFVEDPENAAFRIWEGRL